MFKYAAAAFILVFLMASYTGCGIEGYQPVYSLAAPLGLTAEQKNGYIQLTFWGENNEDYFSGYYIYAAISQSTLLNTLGPVAGSGLILLNTNNGNGIYGKPTIYGIGPTNQAVLYSYLAKNYTNNSSYQSLNTYFFCVKAYSQQYNIYSYSSAIASIIMQPY